MENITNRILFRDGKLKKLFISYIVVSVFFLAVAALCVIMREYADSLNETLIEWLSFRTNITRIKDATVDMKHTLEVINAIILPDYFSNSSEKQLLIGLDGLKTTMKNDAITVAEISYGDTELSLPVSVRGAMGSYLSLVSDIGKLQSLKFPFFSIKSITIKKGETMQVLKGADEVEEKKVTMYEINGELRLPKNDTTAKENENPGGFSAAGSGPR